MAIESFDAALQQLSKGINLVEASAGTGKTFAIAMLVLRFVVEEKIPLEKILIVTFTNAATSELRGRIRRRLAEARDILDSATSDLPEDKFDEPLLRWSEKFTGKQQRCQAQLLLREALYSIDQAPVFTIHGFCQRMLGEQALESGQPFDCKLLTDLAPLKQEIAEDYWRSLFYGACGDIDAALLADARFASPMALLASVARISTGSRYIPQGEDPAASSEELRQSLVELRRWWLENGAQFRGKLEEAESGGYLKKEFAQEWRQWCGTLDQWCGHNSGSGPFFTNPEWLVKEIFLENLHGNKLRGEKKNAFVREWPFYSGADILLARLQRIRDLYRIDFAGFLKKELSLRLLRQGSMGFDGLIDNLADALASGYKNNQQGLLQQTLANRFQVALIDEFQDTDSRQYHIFARIFGGGSHFLYLIGDPKQAIYSFRGADIDSYFTARKKANRRLTLDRNYRSHPLLIKEIERLFTGRQNPFIDSQQDLPFSPVKARAREECAGFMAADNAAEGMVYWLLPPDSSKKDGRWGAAAARERILQYTVAEIGHLLSDKKWQIYKDGASRPVAPRDIAVLVRTNKSAEKYADMLAGSGIPAVVTSRSSVFSAVECQELLLLLAAILEPGNLHRAKAALAISWFGHDGMDIYAIGSDESRIGRWQLCLMEYGRQWQADGFFAMMGALLRREKVVARLAAAARGERRISNLRQLLALVEQQAGERNLLPREVYQWLLRQNQAPDSLAESELLLESDREAVQIVTMHSAKGLEYSVVFCVDLWGGNDRLRGEQDQILCRDGQGLLIDLGSGEFAEHKREAQHRWRAEEMRLLYVALTRAKVRCYLAWADVKGRGAALDSFQSSLGYLLFPGQDGKSCDYSCQQQQLSARAEKEGVFLEVLAEAPSSAPFAPESVKQKLQRRELLRDDFTSCWRLSSFSSLAGLSEYEYDTAGDSKIEEGEAEIVVAGLPAGARFGSVVHDILEKTSFSLLAVAGKECIQKCIEFAALYGVNADAQMLARLIRQAVTTPLQGADASFSLAQLTDNDCVKEMPFHLLHDRVDTRQFCRLLVDDPAVVPLGEKEMAGYLTGFVDLVCRWQGRYYIIDYKTNNLGDRFADYQGERLLAAMRSHNYGLQYWLYSVALHRYLKKRENNYSYKEHFGGVFYLFVRGMAPSVAGSGIFFTVPPADRVEAVDRLLLGGAR